MNCHSWVASHKSCVSSYIPWTTTKPERRTGGPELSKTHTHMTSEFRTTWFPVHKQDARFARDCIVITPSDGRSARLLPRRGEQSLRDALPNRRGGPLHSAIVRPLIAVFAGVGRTLYGGVISRPAVGPTRPPRLISAVVVSDGVRPVNLRPSNRATFCPVACRGPLQTTSGE